MGHQRTEAGVTTSAVPIPQFAACVTMDTIDTASAYIAMAAIDTGPAYMSAYIAMATIDTRQP